LGKQELLAEILSDNPGALFHLANIERNRVAIAPSDLERIVVGIDPAGTSNANSDRTGIVVAGMDGHGHFYVLADYSLKASPEAWARKAVEAFHTHRADRIIGEANFGGDMVEAVIRNADPNASYSKVHASRGKVMRAEPIAALYEQNRVHHVGTFAELESQMTEWSPAEKSYSPDSLDAAVWALTELSDNGGYGWISYIKGVLSGIFRNPLDEPAPQSVLDARAKAVFASEARAVGVNPLEVNTRTNATWNPPSPPCPKCKSNSVRIGGGGFRCSQCGHQFDRPGEEPEAIYMGRNGLPISRWRPR
jgi:phage terminase large subunit-like protein